MILNWPHGKWTSVHLLITTGLFVEPFCHVKVFMVLVIEVMEIIKEVGMVYTVKM